MMKNERDSAPMLRVKQGVYSRRHALRTLLATSALFTPLRGLAQFDVSTRPWAPAQPHGAFATSLPLRLLKIRHSAFLVELNSVRVGIDLCFATNLNMGPLFSAPSSTRLPESVGELDLLLFSSARGDHFDAFALKRMPHRNATCLVADAALAKRLRNLGFRRIEQVRAGQQISLRGLEITVSPSQELWGLGAAVGFHLRCATRSVWHMGAPPPLDLFSATVDFARRHPAEVVLACADGQRLLGRPLGMALDDALLLGALAQARIVIPQHDAAKPTPLAALLWERPPMRPLSLPPTTRLVSLESNIWYRVRERSLLETHDESGIE